MFEITFLRHGESLGNFQGIIQGQSDYPLTEVGIRQAQSLASRWSRERRTFDRLISSPLGRARQTAEIIAAELGLPLTLDAEWSERCFGKFEGCTLQEIQQISPGVDLFHPYDAVGEVGESLVDVYLRASRALESLLRQPAGRYLVVSHGGILHMAFYAILGLAPQGNFNRLRFHIGNTAFTRVTYHPERRQWRIGCMNDQEHLTNEV